MEDYLNDIKNYNTRQSRPQRGKCALVVIDMQNYFLEKSGFCLCPYPGYGEPVPVSGGQYLIRGILDRKE